MTLCGYCHVPLRWMQKQIPHSWIALGMSCAASQRKLTQNSGVRIPGAGHFFKVNLIQASATKMMDVTAFNLAKYCQEQERKSCSIFLLLALLPGGFLRRCILALCNLLGFTVLPSQRASCNMTTAHSSKHTSLCLSFCSVFQLRGCAEKYSGLLILGFDRQYFVLSMRFVFLQQEQGAE